jgi:hypothetical protein
MQAFGRCPRPLRRINPAATLEPFREEDLAQVERWCRPSMFSLDLGARVLVPTRIIVPSIEWLHDVRVNQWIVRLPEEHPLVQQHRLLLGAIAGITWTGARNRHEAVCNGLRILLVRGYDSLRQIQEEDMKVLHLRWSKGTDALDAALCSLGVFSRTPKRGSARYSRRRRLTASELVEISGVPPRFRQVMILYLETYEARVSDVYKTLRHKSIAIAHFWRFMQEKHPRVKHCSAVLPRHVRDHIPCPRSFFLYRANQLGPRNAFGVSRRGCSM